MELRQLKHFVTAVEQGSISAAARVLNLAQPAISSSIKKLEQELKTPLFNRRDRGISLTKAGSEFVLHARQILRQADDAKLAMQAMEGLDQGQVDIAVPSMLGSYYFPPLLMAFRHQYPNIDMSIQDTGTRNIRRMLLDGEVELGVVASKDLTPELESGPLIREEMVVCMSVDHPLAEKEVIEYADFLSHDLVLFRKGYYHHILLDRICRKENIKPRVAFISNLLPLIKSVIRQGYAISPMWQVAIREDDQIVTRPFAETFEIDLSLAWRKDSYLSRANQVFRDFILAEVNGH
ncbi:MULTISPECIES: LysR family transcriptional regulator [Vibrio]|uniref:LysR family transcriptional regulator n=1 Tax=Vibrio ostreae TaxID=2841925 RepID=A0A975U7T6_9VIBR|nr:MULTISPECIES: LysR family transcriptional regulator [Vibrio]QXO15922.1 LysR family transcriptional regulator [Vibrio ostreae]QXO15972.1 LysR family transcriptional regulator [Vibrio ostreae]WGY44742.1 LysR family transcriptional regulator [Vibrio sp. ABG19]